MKKNLGAIKYGKSTDFTDLFLSLYWIFR